MKELPPQLCIDVSSTLRRNLVSLRRAKLVAEETLRSEGVTRALLSITFVPRRRIAQINRDYLKRSGATDVIAFAFSKSARDSGVVGDVYIAPEVAGTNAAREGVPLREEIDRLVVHGVLHVLGHDHPDSAARTASQMWRRQESIVRKLA